MEKQTKKLAVDILKSTTSYRLGHLKYDDSGNRVTVWCEIPESLDDPNFYHMEIAQLFVSLFSIYMRYNEVTNKCELLIF